MASLIPIFKKELEHESCTTHKMFERIPEDKFEWRPHPRSMSMKRLSAHVAEMFGWIEMAFIRDGLDFAKGEYKPKDIKSKQELMQFLDEMVKAAASQLLNKQEDRLTEEWVLKNGDVVLAKYNRAEVIRMALNQVTHHRAQLGVYLRLLDVPIPGSYGPSADEH